MNGCDIIGNTVDGASNNDALSGVGSPFNATGNYFGSNQNIGSGINGSNPVSQPANGSQLQTFHYDREGAARYAIDQSRKNFDQFPVGSGNLVLLDDEGSVRGLFKYDGFPTHTFGNTGSSTFLSEVLFVGGFPMTFGFDSFGQIDMTTCSTEAGDTNPSSVDSWRLCETSQTGVYDTTNSWRNHIALLRYFTGNSLPVAYVSPYSEPLTTNYNNTGRPLIGIDPHINYSTGLIEGQAGADALSALFDTGGILESIQTGDYIYLDQGRKDNVDVQHGFIIVGWASPINVNNDDQTTNGVNEGLEMRSTVNALRADELSIGKRIQMSYTKTAGTVPYVVDFSYGVKVNPSDESEYTGWLQDIRPRPFYMSSVSYPTSSFDIDIVRSVQVTDLTDYGNRHPKVGAIPYSQFTAFTCAGSDCYGGQSGLPTWQFFGLPDQINIEADRYYDAFTINA